MFYEYWNRGLTVAQLLDPHSDIYTTEAIVFDKDNKISQSDSKRTNGKMINNTQDTKLASGITIDATDVEAMAEVVTNEAGEILRGEEAQAFLSSLWINPVSLKTFPAL